MADLNIQINDPVLQLGEKFVVRYRLLPSGSFSSWTNRTNSAFTITGLSAGQYEIEIAFVKADGTQCPSVFEYYDVVVPLSPFSCPAFTVSQLANPARLSITYTGGSGTAACGYTIEYRKNSTGAFSRVTFPTLPASPITLALPSGNASYQVRILSNACDGYLVCYDGVIGSPEPPECTGLSGLSFSVKDLENPQSQQKKFLLTVTATTQSTIPTTSITANAVQAYNLLPSLPWTGSSPITGISPTAFSFTMVLYFNGFTNGARLPASSTYPYTWDISFVDACGKTHRIFVDYP